MKIPATWREKIDDWEQRAEPFLGKYFFLFGPPLDRKAFLKAALIIMTAHRAVAGVLAVGLCLLWYFHGYDGDAEEDLPPGLAYTGILFLAPFAAIIYRRLFGMGISFPLMGLLIILVLYVPLLWLPFWFWWNPCHIAFQLGIVLLLLFKTRREAWNGSAAPPADCARNSSFCDSDPDGFLSEPHCFFDKRFFLRIFFFFFFFFFL